MSDNVRATDWQACGVVSLGGAVIAGVQVYFFEFRSQQANCRATFLFIGAGLGLGGDLGGAVAPDPSSIVHNQNPDLWTSLEIGNGPFSASDLDMSYAGITQATVAGAYGYSAVAITAGFGSPLFEAQNVSGWTVGVGVTVSAMAWIWKQLGPGSSYY
jgi:hypothetical protein